MKTLDEVIELSERCTLPYPGDCLNCKYFEDETGYDCRCKIISDALFYLKEYRWIVENCAETLAEKYPSENVPLTWDKLQQMEGKPVWVEVLSDEIDLSSRWMLVARKTKEHILPLAYTDDIGHWIFCHEDKLGKTWQAYRKEHHDDN